MLAGRSALVVVAGLAATLAAVPRPLAPKHLVRRQSVSFSAASSSTRATSASRSSASSAAAVASSTARAWQGTSSFANAGNTGVSAMQVNVLDNDRILILDKRETNPLKVDGTSVWGSVYSISDQTVRALVMETDSFCAGGGWLSNGTLVSVGGTGDDSGPTGWNALRLYSPTADGADTDQIYENPNRLKLTSDRWYPSTTRLEDGSLIIFGGMNQTGFNNAPALDNPTIEYWPPKFDGLAIYSTFLHDALNTNLFPVTFLLPDGDIFVAANTLAMTYNWQTNKETRLPQLPNDVKVNYPATAASALLPLTITNNWTAEVLLCGGTDAEIETTRELSSRTPGSAQCSRMAITPEGIAGGWLTEDLPEARMMGDAVLTPDGQVLIINGAGQGVAGFSNVDDGIGESNARDPIYRPTLYDPNAPAGSRFSTNFPSSPYERMYHSSATLVPDGRVFVAGSNPNNDFSDEPFITRYNAEMFSPPYINMTRPSFTGAPTNLLYGASFSLEVTLPANTSTVQAVVMDLGYSTHGVHMSQRWVELTAGLNGTSLVVNAPATAGLFPPGPGWVHILADGVPSEAAKVMVGDGSDPPFSAEAMAGLLENAGTTPVLNGTA